MNARLLFVHALSPLHAGTGQGVGVIDLPIAREKATGLPFLPGSSLKGTLRDLCQHPNTRKNVFGPDTNAADEHAGSVQFSDQRLLLLPVRSLAGTFAWVTSPYILRRFLRDARSAGIADADLPATVPTPAGAGECAVANSQCSLLLTQDKVILEDLDLSGKKNTDVTKWAKWIGDQVFPGAANEDWRAMLNAQLCVVADDIFGFLIETATEITARIKLMDDLKTVSKGGLWYEEALPAETILSGLMVGTPVPKTGLTADAVLKNVEALMDKPAQFGGKATVGRGLCLLHIAGKGA